MLNRNPRKGWILTQESFDELLAWLNADREQAGRKYEDIRNRLIRIFMHRGCTVAEDLADKAINQVARKVREIKEYYVGDPALYFYGVARNIHNDYIQSITDTMPVTPELLAAPPAEESDVSEPEHNCLEQCLDKLSPQNRELLLEYYRETEGAKVEKHKEMARRLGIAVNALRIRMCRLRANLKECMRECLGSQLA
jgi:RNA polymerase sigma factor (sigma-70 family)